MQPTPDAKIIQPDQTAQPDMPPGKSASESVLLQIGKDVRVIKGLLVFWTWISCITGVLYILVQAGFFR